jgi:hypothetical protein
VCLDILRARGGPRGRISSSAWRCQELRAVTVDAVVALTVAVMDRSSLVVARAGRSVAMAASDKARCHVLSRNAFGEVEESRRDRRKRCSSLLIVSPKFDGWKEHKWLKSSLVGEPSPPQERAQHSALQRVVPAQVCDEAVELGPPPDELVDEGEDRHVESETQLTRPRSE